MPEDLSDSQSATALTAQVDPELVQTLRENGPARMVFGRFRLIRELGKGGMGVVWLAKDERLELDVALKFLPGLVASDAEALHDLRKEITRCLKLTHEGVVRVYDLHEDDREGLAAIAMEYVEGTTLSHEKGAQPERCFDVNEPLTGWLRQICSVLEYVHGKQIVHRDLKPQNVMITKEGRIKIADFGIAASLCDSHSRLSQHPGSSGTPVYMSPQQALAGNPTVADDIYSLAASVYELLTSKPPFFRGNMSVILNAVASQIPPRMEQRRKELGVTGKSPVPTPWEALIAKGLAKEPSERPASAAEFAQRLGLGEQTTVRAKSGQKKAMAAAAVALAVAAPFIWSTATRRPIASGGGAPKTDAPQAGAAGPRPGPTAAPVPEPAAPASLAAGASEPTPAVTNEVTVAPPAAAPPPPLQPGVAPPISAAPADAPKPAAESNHPPEPSPAAEPEPRAMEKSGSLVATPQSFSKGIPGVIYDYAPAGMNEEEYEEELSAKGQYHASITSLPADRRRAEKVKEVLKSEGITLTVEELPERPPAYLASEPLVLYYGKQNKVRAAALAQKLTTATGLHFTADEGATPPAEAQHRFAIHCVSKR